MDNVADLDDPRSRGKGLSGELHGIWRYRVPCRIDDSAATIQVLDAGHRRRVYG
jgi:mRNA interferase RelE/StbE